MKIYKLIASLLITVISLKSQAQNKPIGYWRAHMPYNSAIGIATDGQKIFVACNQSFFAYDTKTGEMNPYSKVDGMSDVGMQAVAYDPGTSNAILAYSNGNIDLFANNTFYNLPDLKIKTVAVSKNINNIFPDNGFAYLSTDLGIVVLDLVNRNVKETYTFSINKQTIPIYSFISAGNYFYAASKAGLYRADKNSQQLQNFAIWHLVDSSRTYKYMAANGNKLFMASNDSLFTLVSDTVQFLYHTPTAFRHLDAAGDNLLISEYNTTTYKGTLRKMSMSYQVTDSFTVAGEPRQALQTLDGATWVGDAYNGLSKLTGSQTSLIVPEGPNNQNSFDIYANNKDVIVAHGGFNEKYVPFGSGNGFSDFNNEDWKIYKQYSYAPFWDSIADISVLAKDETDGTLYAGSFSTGLFILNADGSYQTLKTNSILDRSTPNPGWWQVFGLALDHENNLWMTLFGSEHQLYVRVKSTGNWYKFSIPFRTGSYPYAAGNMVVDDYDQIWYICPGPDLGGGAMVYNYNGTPEDPSDDKAVPLHIGTGAGNLPSDRTLCIAKDKNGDIWIGTTDGIGIISCASTIMQTQCDGSIPIVQYDNYAGYLFKGENVRSIAVDGANRKWVGTDNGVWLLSPDANQIISRFTQDNSPLPSNLIQKIAVDPVTGDVYIGTQQGMVSYHGTATDGGTSNSNVITYPNPVPGNYNGTVAIKGLVANGDVRITDITGQLVYRTTALGGQAVWNGKDYTGHRPEAGVYLIFVTNKDGSQTFAGKMVLTQ